MVHLSLSQWQIELQLWRTNICRHVEWTVGGTTTASLCYSRICLCSLLLFLLPSCCIWCPKVVQRERSASNNGHCGHACHGSTITTLAHREQSSISNNNLPSCISVQFPSSTIHCPVIDRSVFNLKARHNFYWPSLYISPKVDHRFVVVSQGVKEDSERVSECMNKLKQSSEPMEARYDRLVLHSNANMQMRTWHSLGAVFPTRLYTNTIDSTFHRSNFILRAQFKYLE